MRYEENRVNSQLVVFSVPVHLSSFPWHLLRLIWITINMTKRWESPPQINMQHCVIYIQCQHSLLDCQYITCCLFTAVEAEYTDRPRGEWMRVRWMRKTSGDETHDGQSGNCAADRMRSCISACDEHSFLWISLSVYALSRCLPCSELALPVDRSGEDIACQVLSWAKLSFQSVITQSWLPGAASRTEALEELQTFAKRSVCWEAAKAMAS